MPNALAPRKRPHTTLSPSLGFWDGTPWLAFGTPGGDQQDQWSLLLAELHAGDQIDWTRAAVDASHVRAKGEDGPSPVNRARPGSKHHVLTDATGIPLAVLLTGGNRHDVTQLKPLLDAVDLRGAHDFRHSFATWLEDAGIPARVIDELMGHEASTRGAQHLAAPWAPITATPPRRWPPGSSWSSKIAWRLSSVSLSRWWRPSPPGCHAMCSDDYGRRFWQISGKWRLEALRVWKGPGH